MAVDVGSVYVNVIPNMAGFTAKLSEETTAASAAAGAKASEASSTAIAASAEKGKSKISTAFGGLGKIAAVTFGALFAEKALDAYDKVEKQQNRLEYGVAKLGPAFEEAFSGMGSFSEKFSAQTGINIADITKLQASLTNLGATFLKTVGPEAAQKDIKDLTEGLVNMASATGKPLQMFMRSVGPSILNTPERAIPMLVKFNAITQEQAAAWTAQAKAGDRLAVTQKLITAIQERYAGAAAKATTPTEKLKNDMNLLEVTVGKQLEPAVKLLAATVGALPGPILEVIVGLGLFAGGTLLALKVGEKLKVVWEGWGSAIDKLQKLFTQTIPRLLGLTTAQEAQTVAATEAATAVEAETVASGEAVAADTALAAASAEAAAGLAAEGAAAAAATPEIAATGVAAEEATAGLAGMASAALPFVAGLAIVGVAIYAGIRSAKAYQAQLDSLSATVVKYGKDSHEAATRIREFQGSSIAIRPNTPLQKAVDVGQQIHDLQTFRNMEHQALVKTLTDQANGVAKSHEQLALEEAMLGKVYAQTDSLNGVISKSNDLLNKFGAVTGYDTQALSTITDAMKQYGKDSTQAHQAETDAIATARQAWNDWKTQTADSINSVIGSISDLTGQEHISARKIAEDLDKQLAKTKKFGHDLNTIASDGSVGAKELVKQLIAAGPAGEHMASVIANATPKVRKHIEDDIGKSLKESDTAAGNLEQTLTSGFANIAASILVATGQARTMKDALDEINGHTFTATVQIDTILRSKTGGGTSQTPHALGGSVDPLSPYLVGEAGEELFVPDVPGTIIPHNQLRKSGTSGDLRLIKGTLSIDDNGNAYIRGVATDEYDDQAAFNDRLARSKR